MRGDFGTSISLRESVTEVVFGRLPATLELAFLALVLAVAIGGFMAILAARWRGTATEAGVDLFNGIALSVPDFLWGLTFILLFGVALPIFDISGRVTPTLELPFVTPFFLIESIVRLRFDLTLDLLGHMLMPAMALALPLAAVISQILKTSLKEVMHQDYALIARTKGFSETYVILHEALRNAVTPSLTVVGVQFTFLIGGTVIVERLFSYEGLGNLAIDAVISRDLPLDPGHRAAVRGDIRRRQSGGRSLLRRAQPEAAAWLSRAPCIDVAASGSGLARPGSRCCCSRRSSPAGSRRTTGSRRT